jgi:hypothetical protein
LNARRAASSTSYINPHHSKCQVGTRKKKPDKIRTLKTEGCGTQDPELEFQGLKPPILEPLMSELKLRPPKNRGARPQGSRQKASGDLSYKNLRLKK